jgi:hypothetical protein
MKWRLIVAITTLPLGKITPEGIMRGTITVFVSENLGYFNVSSGTVSCAGSYSLGHVLPTMSVPVLCNDGRKGIIISTRDYCGMSGGGTFTLNDGTTGNFIFGDAANKLQTTSASSRLRDASLVALSFPIRKMGHYAASSR